MAEHASSVFPQILKNIEELLTKAQNLTEENKFPQKELMEMFEIFQSMRAEEYREATDLARRFGNAVVKFIWGSLFNSYLALKATLSCDSILVSSMENAQKEESSVNIPEAMKLKIENGKYYIEQAKKCIKNIDKRLPSLLDKVKDAVYKKIKFPIESPIQEHDIVWMEMEAEDIERELKKCKSYQEQAEEAISKLKIEIDEELKRNSIRSKAKGAGILGGFFLGGSLIMAKAPTLYNYALKDIMGKIAVVLFGVAAFMVWKGWKSLFKGIDRRLHIIFRNHSGSIKEIELISIRLNQLGSKLGFSDHLF